MPYVVSTIITNIYGLLTAFHAEEKFGEVEYSDWGLVQYYLYIIQDYFADYPWQIVTSYSIAIICVIVQVVLLSMFFVQVMLQQRRGRKERTLYQ